jgi:class 3 adenylate cyclase
MAVNGAFADRNNAGGDPPLRVRIGVAAGEPVDHNDDIFGAAVTLASRLCADALPEHILVSSVVSEMGADQGFSFGEQSLRSLKGFSAPVPVFELLGTNSG